MADRFGFPADLLQVLDSLVISLSKYTALLNPAHPKAAIAFGNNEQARAATATLFDLANRCRLAWNLKLARLLGKDVAGRGRLS